MIIALDGPSGAGKSTISKLVAERLGMSCLDTGAMYRCIAWQAVQDGVAFDDEKRLDEIARTCDISFEIEPGSPKPKAIFVGDVDVTTAIRTGEIDLAASAVSAVPAVRVALVDQQRRIGAKDSYIVDGRDIGSVVFPDAPVKVFLTASAEERARRRVAQNAERGIGSTDFDTILAEIIQRDEQDSTRAMSPLVQAKDAVLVDSTDMTIEEVVDKICELAEAAHV